MERSTAGPGPRLTPFEHFMFIDGRDDRPLTFWLRLRFAGHLCEHRLRESLTAIASQYPLLTAVVSDGPGGLTWKLGCVLPAVTRVSATDTETGVPNVEPIDLRRASGCRIWLVDDEHGSSLWCEFHHAICDGLAAAAIIESALRRYAGDVETLEAAQLGDLNALERAAGRVAGLVNATWQWALMAWKASTFFVLTPLGLSHGVKEAETNGRDASSRFLAKSLGPLDGFRRAARRAGGTINDLLLSDLVNALRDELAAAGRLGRRPIRLMIPMNLREPGWVELGVNRCGMVHLDFPAHAYRPRETTLPNVIRRMRRYREFRAGRVFLVAVGLATRMFGSSRCLRAPWRCSVTTVFSNLGELWSESPLLCGHRRLLMNEVELREVDFFPPLRDGLPCAFGAVSYAGELRFCIHLDPTKFTNERAVRLLTLLCEHIQQTI